MMIGVIYQRVGSPPSDLYARAHGPHTVLNAATTVLQSSSLLELNLYN
jgi:hypothetical protein